MKKFLAGIFVGMVIAYNLFLNQFEYRISFYGFVERQGKVIPLIKLRKKIKGYDRVYNPLDEGLDLDLGIVMVPGRVEFDNKKIDRIIKERYCQ